MCTQTVPHRPNTRGMVAAGCTCFWRRRCGPGHDASQWQHGRQPGGAGEASQNPSEIRTKLGGTLDTLSRTCGMIGGSRTGIVRAIQAKALQGMGAHAGVLAAGVVPAWAGTADAPTPTWQTNGRVLAVAGSVG
jgi:hypothetical protein